MYLFTKSQK